MDEWQVIVEKKAVILNGVSPWAQAGAKRSEESLKVTGGGGGDGRARVPAHRLRPLYSQRFFTARRPAFARAALRSE